MGGQEAVGWCGWPLSTCFKSLRNETDGPWKKHRSKEIEGNGMADDWPLSFISNSESGQGLGTKRNIQLHNDEEKSGTLNMASYLNREPSFNFFISCSKEHHGLIPLWPNFRLIYNVGDTVKHWHLWGNLGPSQHCLSRVVHSFSPIWLIHMAADPTSESDAGACTCWCTHFSYLVYLAC